MKETAVAFLDALGFKGCWQLPQADRILGNLSQLAALSASVAEAVAASINRGGLFVIDTWRVAVSDTLILGASAEPTEALRALAGSHAKTLADWTALFCVNEGASTVAGRAAQLSPAFTYRGAISFGPCSNSGQFVLGPAVDEAAELEKFPEAAIVMYCPTAEDLLQKGNAAAEKTATLRFRPSLVPAYPVPGKAGVFRTHAVNPLAYHEFPEAVVAPILATFDQRRIGVVIKRQNTEAFLSAALAYALADEEREGRWRRLREATRAEPSKR